MMGLGNYVSYLVLDHQGVAMTGSDQEEGRRLHQSCAAVLRARRRNSPTFIVDFGGFRLNGRLSRLSVFFRE